MVEEKYILIDRYSYETNQTISKLFLLGEKDDFLIKEFDSLELPWLNNKRRISCIPTGEYEAIQHNSPKFGKCLWIKGVPNRSEILIHYANFHYDLLGCVGVGQDLFDINKDGDIDITSSRNAMKKLLQLIDNQQRIKVIIK